MKPTHFADIEDRTIWRVWFTPPEGMTASEIEDWLHENWADCDCEQIHDKDIHDNGGTDVICVELYNPEK